MQKTINSETQRPYTISMIERLMHDIHFAVDPNSNSKKQVTDAYRLILCMTFILLFKIILCLKEFQIPFCDLVSLLM